MLFCNHCGNEGEPKYSLAPISAILAMAFLGFGLLLLFSGTATGFLLFAVIGLGCAAVSYDGRRLFCRYCGSGDLLPHNSPKAMEFKNRSRAFEHVAENRLSPESEGRTKRVSFRP